MRICIPTEDDRAMDARVYDHFGSAPFFALADTESGDIEMLDNAKGRHRHGNCEPIDHIDADHPDCTVDPNYAVAQFSGDYAALVVPARRTTSLDDLGVPSTAWPQVSMVETNTNQDACLGAVLTLTYTGSARRAHP